MRLDGQQAIVTGAGGALGGATSAALAADGADVAGFDLDPDGLATTAAAVRTTGRQALECTVDLCDAGAVAEAVARVASTWGGVDILVNNAGGGAVMPFAEITPELWRSQLDTNLTSVFNTSRAVVPQLRARGGGRIVNIASVAAIRGGRLVRHATAYAAAKAGVVGLTKALAIELATEQITVNCIAPGAQHTPARDRDTRERREALLSQVPSRELGRPEDLAQTVVFLCAPAARYLTGVILPQDGGHSI
jgi:3-oxoacyl-[acyl-carrier protein] reductase